MTKLSIHDITRSEHEHFFKYYNYSHNINNYTRTIYRVDNIPYEKTYYDTHTFVVAVKHLYARRHCILLGFEKLGEES